MRLTDEELTALLCQALDPGNPSPPPESVGKLHRLVSSAAPRRRRVPLRSRMAVATAAFLAVSGSAVGAAVASGATLPEPLRVIASGIGLPVDSVGLAQAKTDADRLRRDLDRRDVAEVPRDAAALQSSFTGLSSGERHSIDDEVDSLLELAAPYDGNSGEGTERPSGSGSASVPGGSDNDGGAASPTTTVAGSQPTSSDGAGVVSGSTSGSDGGSGGSSSTTVPSATTGDSGGGSTSTTTSGTDGGGGTSGGGTSGGGTSGGTDGGSVSGTDGGG